MYILCVLSLVGAIDHVITTWNNIVAPNPIMEHVSSALVLKFNDYQKTSITWGVIIIIVYLLCFFSTIIMAPFDVLLFIKNGYAPSSAEYADWSVAVKSDSRFEDEYARWSSLNSLRAATSLLAWILCVVLLWRDVSRYAKLWFYVRRIRKTAVMWMKRARLLQGMEDYDVLSQGELIELIASQEVSTNNSILQSSIQ